MTTSIPNCPQCGCQPNDPGLRFVGPLLECPTCGLLFPSGRHLAEDPSPPRGARVYREGGSLFLVRPWFHWAFVYGLVFTLSIPFITGSFTAKPWTRSSLDMGISILILCLLVALVVHWVMLLVNRTTVEVSDTMLHVRRRPIPWKADQAIARRRIRGFFIKRRDVLGADVSKHRAYHLMCRVVDGPPVVLFHSLARAEHAAFYLNELNQVLSDQGLPA